MLVTSLVIALTIQINHRLGETVFLYLIATLPAMVAVYAYFYKIQARSPQLSLVLTTITFTIGFSIEILASHIVVRLFQPLHNPFYDSLEPLPFMVLAFSLYLGSILATLLLAKVLQHLLTGIAQTGRLQSTVALVSGFMMFFFLAILNIQHYLGATVILFSWTFAFIISFSVAVFMCFLFYIKSLRAEQKVHEKEIEHRAMLRYMDESDHQQRAMGQFKHDYQNILLSLRGFIKEKRWDKLEQYFDTHVEPASEVITKNDFALEGLGKIGPLEIKGFLTAKLTLAQHLGIDAKFDAVEVIDHIPVDSVALVRMLGIMLDNAMEELTTLGQGQLSVACFKVEGAINFVIQNTCRPDTPSLRQLKQSGFSTKGEGRGLGLSNLSGLVNALPNTALQTLVEDGHFTQILMIGGGV